MVTIGMLALLTGCQRCEVLDEIGLSGSVCPSGRVRLGLQGRIDDAQRGSLATLRFSTQASWVIDRGDGGTVVHRAFPGEVKVRARLDGQDEPLELIGLERDEQGGWSARVTLPEVHDGDHVVVVDVDAGFDQATLRVPLSFYNPALIHTLTDRPIYRPGEEILMRAVALDRADRVPLAQRPGRWTVQRGGVVLLDEPARTGPWGVAASSLPLDPLAPHGVYTVTYASGGERDAVQVRVEPFETPRLAAEVQAERAWSRRGDRLRFDGVARYRSGVPLAGATAKARVRVQQGAWPAPLAWEEPIELETGADGRFTVDLGPVPGDLRGRVTLALAVTIEEPGGESIVAQTTHVLSEHDLLVEPLTELGEALASGHNNRAYVRVMTPDGVPLPGVDLTLTNPWDATKRPQRARTDADGVALVQVDPGEPVTLVTEPMPVRTRPAPPPPPDDAPTLRSMLASFSRPLSLTEQAFQPRLLDAVAGCQHLDTGMLSVTLRVSGGRVVAVRAGQGDLAACVERGLMGAPFPVRGPDTYRAEVALGRSRRPSFDLSTEGPDGAPSDVVGLLEAAAARARACLAPGRGEDGEQVGVLHWQVGSAARAIQIEAAWDDAHGLRADELACVSRSFSGLALTEEQREQRGDSGLLGATRLVLDVPVLPGAPKPPPAPVAMTRTGFELVARASDADRAIGSAPVRFEVGQMPPIRLRATPPVVEQGGEVVIELLRSGDADIELPKELALKQHGKIVANAELDGNRVVYRLPPEVDGFLDVDFRGASTRLYVERTDRLALSLEADRDAYRPGEPARLTLRTTRGGQGGPAAVGLVGVDAALGQVAPLPGADAFDRVVVRAASNSPAFGSFDAASLVRGRIRGVNARQAAVLRVSRVPVDRFERPTVSGSGAITPAQDEALARAFDRAVEDLVTRLRAWERGASDGEQLDYPKMRALWGETLAALRERGEPAEDAYGRELTLARLPRGFAEQLDPRQLVGDATRLPEDSMGWMVWLDKEVRGA